MDRRIFDLTPLDRAHEVAALYDSYPTDRVFGRSVAEVTSAARHRSVVHLQRPDGQMTATAGIYDRARMSFDIGGVLVAEEGFKSQWLMMATLAVMTHVSHEQYDAITATCFSDNLPSIINIERARFTTYRGAPADAIAVRDAKAGGKPYRFFEVKPDALAQLAQDLLTFRDRPVLFNRHGERREIELRHPLFSQWLSAMRQLAELSPANSGNP